MDNAYRYRRRNKIGNNRICFLYMALGLYLIAKDLEITSAYHTINGMPIILQLLRYTSYIMIIVISFFMSNYSKKEFVRYLVFILLLTMVSLTAGNVTIIFSFMFIFAARDIPFMKLLKYVVTIQIIITVCIVSGCMAGIIEDWTYQRGDIIRHSLGYGYPNALPTIYFYSIIAICCLMQKKIKLWHLVIFEGINYFIFLYTNTRTAFALVTIVLIVFWVMKYYTKPLTSNPITRIVYVHSVYLIAIVSIVACFLYIPSNPAFKLANELINNRLSLGHDALMNYDITLFGQNIEWYGYGGLGYTIMELAGEYNYVDCAYVKILLDNGLVMLLIAIFGYMYAASTGLIKGNRYFCMALLFANVYSMIEPRYIEVGLNSFVWCMSALICNEIYLAFKSDYNGLIIRSPIRVKGRGQRPS